MLCCSQVQFNENCPARGWLKWNFDGPMLRVHKPFMPMCLECQGGLRNSDVGTARCSGTRQQRWHLELQYDHTTQYGDILFTINSSLYPDQCVTIDEASEHGGLVLRDCQRPPNVRQLFYINRNWFQTVTVSQKIIDYRAIQDYIQEVNKLVTSANTERANDTERQPLSPLTKPAGKTYR